MKAVGFDLDSTIAYTLHRQWMVEKIMAKEPGYTWDRYSLECDNDTPIAGTVAMMRALPVDTQIHIITGRSDGAQLLTEAWLSRYSVPYDDLHMRPEGDRTPNGKYKVQVLNQLMELGLEFQFFAEDWPEAGDYITKHTGIPCLLVNANYPPDAPHQNENTRSV